jgi:hypothetical protein
MRGRLSHTREMIWSRAPSASVVGACISVFLLTRNSPAAEQTALEPSTPVPQEELSLQAFGSKNPTCVEWNDSCATCRRDSSGEAHCSTRGIACQPKDVVCKASSSP